MLPGELLDLFEKYTEDDCSLYVTKADNSSGNLIVDLYIDTHDIDDKGPVFQKWALETSGHKKNNIKIGSGSSIKIVNDHPLLWEFTDIQCELYFKGQIKNIQKLFFDLYSTHKTLFGNYQCFNILFDLGSTNFTRLPYPGGLLTKGAKKLIEKYAYCLKQNGLDYSIIGERPTSYWNGEQFFPENPAMKLLILGDSFVIAENFSFVRLD